MSKMFSCARLTACAGLAISLTLAACEPAPPTSDSELNQPVATPEALLDWAIDGKWRSQDAGRDQWRHPKETLQFFGLQPDMTVLELWPGGGWYSQILAPYLARGKGQLIAAHFDPKMAETNAFVRDSLTEYQQSFVQGPVRYGDITLVALGPDSKALAPENSVDLAMTFRNIHNWLNAGYAEKVFADVYAALKPGGHFGIVEHRANADKPADPLARNGYVREAYVMRLAKEAGFELVDSSEINANPADTKDHPFGVWTLPPVRRSSAPGEAPNPEFNHAPYDVMGESDRMTLLFRKPSTDG